MYSSASSGSDNDNDADKVDDFIPPKQKLHLQGVDPQKGWDFRGVHKVTQEFNFIYVNKHEMYISKLRQTWMQMFEVICEYDGLNFTLVWQQ